MSKRIHLGWQFVLVLFISGCMTTPPVRTSNPPSPTEATPTISATQKPTSPVTPTPLPTKTATPTTVPTATPTATPAPEKIKLSDVNSLKLVDSWGKRTSFDTIEKVEYSPSENYILIAGELANSSLIRIYDANSLQEIGMYDLGKGHPSEAVWSPNQDLLAYVNQQGQIEIINADGLASVKSLHADESGFFSLAWSADGNAFAAAGNDKSIWVWDFKSGEKLYRLEGYENSVDKLFWSPQGTYLASTGDNNFVVIWSMADGSMLHKFKAQKEHIDSLTWSSDEMKLATSSTDEPNVYVWNVKTGRQSYAVSGHKYWVSNVEWSSANDQFATDDAAGTLFVRDAKNGKALKYFQEDTSPEFFHWSADGNMICVLSAGGATIKVYQVDSGDRISPPQDVIAGLIGFSWSPDSQKIILWNRDGRIEIWGISSQTLQPLLNPKIGLINDFALSHDYQTVVVGENGGDIRVISTDHNKILRALKWPVTLALSSEERYIAAGGIWDGSILVWDRQSGELIQTLGKEIYYPEMVWLADSHQLITTDQENHLILWDIDTGKQVRQVGTMSAGIARLSLSPDGGQLAALDYQGDLWVWDTANWKVSTKVKSFDDIAVISDLSWSPDSQAIAVGFISFNQIQEGIIQIWSLDDTEQPAEYRPFLSNLQLSLAWSPTGDLIAVSNGDLINPQGELVRKLDANGVVRWSADGFYLIYGWDSIQFWAATP
jgi:WD40 repeat protein